ncbi:MAG TPA: VWA domain-containing protein [Verrucomicrobiota bacterium]|nr:VWA domain-containing protein [Verrucomicrobiota bacterium]HNT14087.1 VWA domain-containing protein [Verrucomicrobiota bacterium]
MNFAEPHFAEPQWLWLAGLGPLALLALQVHAARARARQLARLAAPEFIRELTRSHSPGRRLGKNLLLLLVLICCSLALARPQWGTRGIRVQHLTEDVVFAMDCSRSMLAGDVSPSRLGRAKLAVQDFVWRQSNGRVGLVAFAGQAFLQCPLTFDHGAFLEALAALDDKTIAVPGTDVGAALDEAFRAMEKSDRQKAIVLLTDGEDLQQSGVDMAKKLADQGVVVYAIGVGTEAGAEIQIVNERGQVDWVRDTRGQVVRSRLDEPTLRRIAQATHGSYFPLGALGEGLARVKQALHTSMTGSGASPARHQGIDRFQVPLALALALLVIESLLSTRRRGRAGLAGLVILLIVQPVPTPATPEVPHPTHSPAAGPSPKSAAEFFHAGTAQLQAGKFQEAEGLLHHALGLQVGRVRPATLYNLGQTRYQLGIEELKKSPDATATAQRALGALDRGDQALQAGRSALESDNLQRLIQAYLNGRGARRGLREAADQVRRAVEVHGVALQKWQRALDDFKSALELNPHDQEARENIAILEAAIAKLIDRLRALQQLGQIMGQQRQALGELMKQLRGKIPAEDAPPGASGDEEEDEEENGQEGPRAGQQEGRTQEGKTILISREEASWILDALKLGGDRRLPMGQGDEKTSRDQKGKDW